MGRKYQATSMYRRNRQIQAMSSLVLWAQVTVQWLGSTSKTSARCNLGLDEDLASGRYNNSNWNHCCCQSAIRPSRARMQVVSTSISLSVCTWCCFTMFTESHPHHRCGRDRRWTRSSNLVLGSVQTVNGICSSASSRVNIKRCSKNILRASNSGNAIRLAV